MYAAHKFQLEFTLRETTLVEEEMHNCEGLTERIKECQPYIEEVSSPQPPFSLRTGGVSQRRRRRARGSPRRASLSAAAAPLASSPGTPSSAP